MIYLVSTILFRWEKYTLQTQVISFSALKSLPSITESVNHKKIKIDME